MITLGIDPGTTRIGYGIISQEKNRLTCLRYGILDTSKDKLTGFRQAEEQLNELVDEYRPERVGIEKLFFTTNRTTGMSVSEMRGVILLTLSKKGLPIMEFTPQQVKQNISAYGKADKGQVQRMVQLLLGLKAPVKPDDAADALAIAICCANTKIF